MSIGKRIKQWRSGQPLRGAPSRDDRHLEGKSGSRPDQSPELKDRTGRRRGLAARLTLVFALLAGSLLLIVGIVLTVVSYNAQTEQVIVSQQKTAGEAALVASSYLSQALNTLRVYGDVGSFSGLLMKSLQAQNEELNNILTEYPEFFQTVTLVDAAGDELSKVSLFREYSVLELGSQVNSPAYKAAVLGNQYIADEVQVAAASSLPVIEIGVPVRGRVSPGALLADVSIQSMWNAVADVEVGETGYVYIVDRDSGKLIAHSDLNRSMTSAGQVLEYVPIVRQLMAHETNIRYQYSGLDSEPVIGAAAELPGTNWTLIAELPTAEAMADVRQMLYLLAVLIVIGVVVAAILGLIFPRTIVRPLLALQKGAQEFGAGHLGYVIGIRTGDEIQDVADAFNEMAADLRTSRTELERWGHELEDRVQARTSELATASEQMSRRAVQIRTSAEVARAIASVRDLDQLLSQVTNLISERFGWYHVGIFLVDDQGEYAVLEAANSEGGQRMLARGHKLRVGQRRPGSGSSEASLGTPHRPGSGTPQGIVGSVVSSGEPLIALDVGENPFYFDNPDLRGTRSEMALPLKVGDQIIGALDVQSTESAGYDDEDLAVSSVLADQVAIAIENARLFEQTQRALNEVQTLHRSYVEREWARATVARRDLGYEYRRQGTPPSTDESSPEAVLALTRGDLVVVDNYDTVSSAVVELGPDRDDGANGQRPPCAALAAPIKVRDQVIGVLDLQENEGQRQWTDDDLAMVQAVTDELGQALETARLFEETSRRAEQMATLNRIGLDLTSGLELKFVLQSLYEQCRQVLATDTFYVALYDQSNELIEFPLLTGIDGPIELEPLDIRQESGFTGYVIRTGQLLHVPDTRAVSDDAEYRVLPLSDLPNRSYLAVPLTARGRVIGVLSVQSREADVYTDEDVDLLTTIGTQASIAIENARAYERLMETAEELRELDRLKMQFLANMSHELRTPLNSIIGFARVMLKGIDGPLTELQEADLTSIYNGGQHLLGLINSILDMSKIEAGKMDLSFAEVSLPEVIDGAVSVARALIKGSPIELVSAVPDALPTVWADAQRVRQVLLNLLSNATKFTERGKILLHAEPGPDYVTISVTDSGVGIDPEAQERLFIAFQQVDGSTTRRAEGTGLGLAISRSFVELHGGKIWVESAPGEGSTFYFTLPVYRAVFEEDRSKADLSRSLEPGQKVVLAVDDDAGVITLLKRYLESDGYQVIGVTHSRQALETAQRLAPNLSAITLDILMSGIDGWQVLRSLKRDPQTRSIPVILCSIVDDLEQGIGMGAEACLKKPVTRDEVLEVLERLERRGATGG